MGWGVKEIYKEKSEDLSRIFKKQKKTLEQEVRRGWRIYICCRQVEVLQYFSHIKNLNPSYNL